VQKLVAVQHSILIFRKDNDDSSCASFENLFELHRIDDKFGTLVAGRSGRIDGL
jgi:hypothetical protein